MKDSKHYRILYSESNEDSCLMITVMLKIAAIEVISVRTVVDSWQLAQAEHFDLYLLDSRFPDGDGLDLCRRLREFAPYTPIIIYSGDAYETDKQKGLSAGANIYLTKPYLDDLAETIRHTIKYQKKIRRKLNRMHFESPAKMEQS